MRPFALVFLLIIVFLAFSATALLFLDYVGILSLEELLYEKGAKIPFLKRFVPKKVTYLVLEEERLQHLAASLREKERTLRELEEKIKKKEEELSNKEKELSGYEAQLAREREALERKIGLYEDREKRFNDLATYFQGMSPDMAARILQGLDDPIVIEILRRMEDKTVAMTLMKMDPERAASLTRRMSME
jgi:flagellar motility protein MotE (MotC chaperone)